MEKKERCALRFDSSVQRVVRSTAEITKTPTVTPVNQSFHFKIFLSTSGQPPCPAPLQNQRTRTKKGKLQAINESQVMAKNPSHQRATERTRRRYGRRHLVTNFKRHTVSALLSRGSYSQFPPPGQPRGDSNPTNDAGRVKARNFMGTDLQQHRLQGVCPRRSARVCPDHVQCLGCNREALHCA